MNELETTFSVLFSFTLFFGGTVYIIVTIIKRIVRLKQRPAPHATSKKIESTSGAEHLNTPTPPSSISVAPKIDDQVRAAIQVGAVRAEEDVETALRGLKLHRYFVFRNLIIHSSSSELTFTEIDHVVVSNHGIFCIETKSHKGNIYGTSRGQKWKQYLNGDRIHELNSPFRQNYHHVKSLEMLLHGKLRAQVHSYIAFPYANKVLVDGKVEDMTPSGVVDKINRHQRLVYDDSDVERIAKVLAHMATYRDSLRGQHIDEVRAYIDARVADTLIVPQQR